MNQPHQYQPPPPGYRYGPPPQPVYFQRPPAPPRSITRHGPEIVLVGVAWLVFCVTMVIFPPLGLLLLGVAIWATQRSVRARKRAEAAHLAWRRQTWGY